MSQYTTSPPSYAPPTPKPQVDDDASQPLLGARAGPSGGAIFDQPDDHDVPDDFKYGVSVAESALEIRHAFIRKVYTILFVQILGTVVIGGFISRSPDAIGFVQAHPWTFYTSLIGTLVNLFLLYWKRHSHPLNFILLGSFTLLESLCVGVAIAFYDQVIVLQALLITVGIFVGLTLFTFQSKYDFSGWGTWLFAGLIGLVMTGFVQIFFPFSQTVDLVYASIGALIFSGYIIYDTFIITKRLSPDEAIIASVSLYLDFLNLFLNILRILNNVNDR